MSAVATPSQRINPFEKEALKLTTSHRIFGLGQVAIAIGLAGLLALLTAGPVQAAPQLDLSISHTPTTMPRNDEQLTYQLQVKNTAPASPSVGSTLICDGVPAAFGGTKNWIGSPTPSFKYRWLRNGEPIPGASGVVPPGGPLPTYDVAAADAGAALQCEVTGTVQAYNPAQDVSVAVDSMPPIPIEPPSSPLPPTAPTGNPSKPAITTVETTKRLCTAPSNWTGSPSWTYRWLRNGSPIAGAIGSKYEPLVATANTTTVAGEANVLKAVTTTKGAGTLTSGSATVSGVTTTVGNFLVGQTVTAGNGTPAEGIPAGTTVVSVGAGSIELSAAATASGAKALSGGALPFAVGQSISGTGIPVGTRITAVSGQTLTISANATAIATGVPVAATAPASATLTAGSNSVTVVTSATGTGNLTSGNKNVTGVSTSTGTFVVGQPISGTGIPAGATIAKVGAGTLELSVNATASGVQSLSAGATAPFAVGQEITGAGIPAGTTVTGVSGSTLTLSANATATASEVALWGTTAGPDNGVSLQCEVTGRTGSGEAPTGGRAVAISSREAIGAAPPGVSTNPGNFPGGGTNPTVLTGDATAGTMTLELELPAGEETRAFAVSQGEGWSCTTLEPIGIVHGSVKCVKSTSLLPQAEAAVSVATSIGADALDPSIATASISGGGSAPDMVVDEFHFLSPTPFGVQAFEANALDQAQADYTQAGGHPFSATASFSLNTRIDREGNPAPIEFLKDVATDIPRGFIGNPQAIPGRCENTDAIRDNTFTEPTCPPGAIVGSVEVLVGGQGGTGGPYKNLPLYAVRPERGLPAQFGFMVPNGKTLITLKTRLRPSEGYAIGVDAPLAPKAPVVLAASVTLCGFGANLQETGVNSKYLGAPEVTGCKPAAQAGAEPANPRPLLTNPVECVGGGPKTKLSVDSWDRPAAHNRDGGPDYSDPNWHSETWTSPSLTGCEQVPFDPAIDLRPTSDHADTPTGLDVSLSLPSAGLENPTGVAQGYLKRAVVTLPEGMSVNPAAADGLQACTQAQLGMHDGVPDNEPVACPDASKIGTAEATTPILDEPLSGSIYIATQGDNPFKSLLGLYLVLESKERGILIKLPGKVAADPVTGQLVTTFDNNPQAPIGSVDLHLNAGSRAALLTPPRCGSYDIVSELTPWSATDPDHPTAAEVRRKISTFEVTSGPDGGPCPSGALEPRLNAGLANPVAGTTSPFAVQLSRSDGTQRFVSLDLMMPAGISAYLKGIPYCPDAALAAIPGGEGTGAAELASPSCPAASQIGTVSVGAGGGSNPFYVNTAKVYLAGPYKGAPLSIAVVAPAVAGPFDLGSVVVRSGAYVNPKTAQITVKSDPIPTILHGIPLDIRDIRVSIDRPDFTLAPTNCEAMAVSASVTGEGGGTANASNRFQVGECAALGFKPQLNLKLSGGTKRDAHPKLRAELKQPAGQANINGVSVVLPRTQFIDQDRIGNVCTRPQFDAEACPKSSILGNAVAYTPLLDEPLRGKVYFRANGGERELPDMVVDLKGQVPIELVGYIDSVGKKGSEVSRIRNRFAVVPDAPVTKFVLNLKGGKEGLLVNSTDICAKKFKATVKMQAHNGRARNFSPVIKNDCGKKKKGKKAGKGKKSAKASTQWYLRDVAG
ncbi:MAG: hypothetical protein JJE35_03765 [Thermoleophilia bacterium]|nr:hypothetical protein [Thermoleophilia bacterium]